MYGLRAVMRLPVVVWLALAAASLAQAPREPIFRVGVNLVQVDAVVTDGRGRYVNDLNASDFEIRQGGRPQKVTHCAYIRTGPAVDAEAVVPSAGRAPEGHLPPAVPRPEQVQRTIAVIVDDLGLSFNSAEKIRPALESFIDEQLQPGDLAAIIRTSGDVGALQQFTSDKGKLHAAAERVRWYWRSRIGFVPMGDSGYPRAFSIQASEPGFNRLCALETLNRITFVLKGLAELPGRKSVLLLTEEIALPSDPVVDYAVAIERAHERLLDAATRASATIYSIDPRGLVAFTPPDVRPRQTSPFVDNGKPQDPAASVPWWIHSEMPFSVLYRLSQEGMRYLAKATGGQFLHDINDLSIPFRMAMNDQQGYYLLGYTPDPSTFDAETGQPKFRKITVRVNRRGLTVRSHTGFGGAEDERKTSPPPGSIGSIIAALMSPFAGGDIEVGMTPVFLNTAEQGSFFTTLVNVKAGGLTLREEGDGRMAEGDIALMVFGENGAVADQTAITFNTKLSGADYDRALKDGLSYRLQAPVKKVGPYDVRVAVRDKATGRIGTTSQFVEVPELKPECAALSGIMLQTSASGAPGSEPVPGFRGGSALRIFHPGETVNYSYQILNPKLDKGTQQPNVEAQVRLYHDGKEFFTGTAAPVEVGKDPTRLAAGGDLKIGTDMPPGDYVLQVVVTDLLANVFGADGPRKRTATQYVDFRVAP